MCWSYHIGSKDLQFAADRYIRRYSFVSSTLKELMVGTDEHLWLFMNTQLRFCYYNLKQVVLIFDTFDIFCKLCLKYINILWSYWRVILPELWQLLPTHWYRWRRSTGTLGQSKIFILSFWYIQFIFVMHTLLHLGKVSIHISYFDIHRLVHFVL